MGRDDDESYGIPDAPCTVDVSDELMPVRCFSVTSSPSWRPIRRPVPRCEYCGRLQERGEVQCAGCGAMR